MIKWVELEFQGRSVRVPAVKAQGRLWFHWRGETHVVDIAAGSRRSAGGKGKTQPGVIVAPMPGKITRAGVAVGDKVEAGRTLVVMEAMKMEYTLEADRGGLVTEVNAEVGRQVGLGDVLVRIGEE
jgi:biotin carboxyl carrier protein